MITGASAGLGAAAARVLACAGHALVLVARRADRLHALRDELAASAPGVPVDVITADLSVFGGVRALAGEVLARHGAPAVLVNNAGIVMRERVLTADGLERTMAVNHFAPLLLTRLLLPAMRARGATRVVFVNSDAHRSVRRLRPEVLRADARFTPWSAYANAKAASLAAAFELARAVPAAETGIVVMHPGAVRTGIGLVGGAVGLLWRTLMPFMLTVERGGGYVARAAVAPELDGLTGIYVDRDRIVTPAAAVLDDANRRAVFAASLAAF